MIFGLVGALAVIAAIVVGVTRLTHTGVRPTVPSALPSSVAPKATELSHRARFACDRFTIHSINPTSSPVVDVCLETGP